MSELPVVRSVADYIDLVKAFSSSGKKVWYRGQLNSAWGLDPSIRRRTEWFDNEVEMLNRFRQLTVSRIVSPPLQSDDWGWVCMAQHHRLPTRLLDWSENPLVALYFAVEKDEDVDAGVFALDVHGLNQTTFGTDVGVLLLGRDDRVDNYSPYNRDTARISPLAVIAPQTFDRVIAQSGTFTLTHHNDVVEMGEYAGHHVQKWQIPLTAKADIRIELLKLGVSAASVYPDLDHIAEMIKADVN